MDIDPDVEAFKKSNRGPILLWLGGIVGAVVLGGLYSVSQGGAVRKDLETEGYTNIQVKIKGPFAYTFSCDKTIGSGDTAIKSHCEGRIDRKPFSSSRDEMCTEERRKAPPAPPPRPEGDVIADNLTKMLTDKHMTAAVKCPTVAVDAVKLVCSITPSQGAPIDMEVDKEGDDWLIKRPTHLMDRKRLSEDIAKALGEKTKTAPDVDCGLGILGFEADDHTSCTAKLKGSAKTAKVDVTFNEKGGYDWKTDI